MMRPTTRRWLLAAAAVGAMVGSEGRAEAGLIVACGDANISLPLTENFRVAVDPGNQRFFLNLLGGGRRVLVTGNPIFADLPEAANNFYNSVAGVTSTSTTGAITAESLAGVDLFASFSRATAYTAGEVAALAAFSDAGGTILVMAEGAILPREIATANALLAGLGSGLSVVGAELDRGFTVATGGQIAADPLTSGVSTFTYAYSSRVQGGTTLFTSRDGSTIMAYTDQTNAIPEPSSLVLCGVAALAGLGLVRRCRGAAIG